MQIERVMLRQGSSSSCEQLQKEGENQPFTAPGLTPLLLLPSAGVFKDGALLCKAGCLPWGLIYPSEKPGRALGDFQNWGNVVLCRERLSPPRLPPPPLLPSPVPSRA